MQATTKEANPKPTTTATAEKKAENKKPAATTAQSSIFKTEAARQPSKTGALDWSKAKSKGKETDKSVKVKAEPQEVKISAEPPKKEEKGQDSSTSKQTQPKVRMPRVPIYESLILFTQRGIKRPSPPTEDEEGDEIVQPPRSKPRISEPARTQSSAVAKRGVIHSDDDEESDVPTRITRRKTKSEAAIMEWSDGWCLISQ